MKHTKHFLLMAAMLLCGVGASAHDFEVDGIYYNINSTLEQTVDVTYKGTYALAYSEYEGVVTIPATVIYGNKTYRVTGIDNSTFYGCSYNLTAVYMSEGITSIGDEAFSGCRSLTTVTIPSTLSSLGEAAFENCASLSSIILPDGVASIKKHTFSYCESLTSIIIGNGVTEIAEFAFNGCESLSSIVIPEGAYSIGKQAFDGCSNLKSLTIPQSVASIGVYAFMGCTGELILNCNANSVSVNTNEPFYYSAFTKLTIGENVSSIGKYAFSAISSFASITSNAVNPPIIVGVSSTFQYVDKSIPVYVPASSVSAYQTANGWKEFTNILPIPTSDIASGSCGDNLTWRLTEEGELIIEGIGEMTSTPWKDSYSLNIKKVTINEGVSSIGNYAFNGCSNLTSIDIPESVESIGWTILHGTEWYNNQQDGIVYAANILYDYKGSIPVNTSINIKDGIKYIAPGAFLCNEELSSITLPSSLECIGEQAFYCCTNLTFVNIPENVTLIGYRAFFQCTNLASSIVIPAGVRSIENETFHDCGKLPSISFSEGLTNIGESAFSRCGSLSTIALPQSLRTIGNSAFASCVGLTSISVSGNITSMGKSIFSYCRNLVSVNISDGLETIGTRMFEGCQSLSSFTCYAKTPPAVEYDAFKGISSTAILYVPKSSLYTYETEGWSEYFSRIESLPPVVVVSGNCGDDVTWNLTEDGVLIIKGKGTMHDYSPESDVPWSKYKGSVKTVVIEDGVTGIGNNAFRDCSSLTSITIPESVRSIGSAAFANCSELTDVYCNAESVPSTETTAFDGSSPEYATLHVPASAIDSYMSTSPWSNFDTIVPLTNALVTGITLSQSSATIVEGNTLTLTATIAPIYATDPSVTWSSSDENVATVDNNGKVTAIAPGTATITATANDGSGVSASCKVTVVKKEISVTGIELNRTSATLSEGATLALTATVTPSDADDTSVTWSCSDPNVATVDNEGKVTAIAPGTATITATANDGSGVSAQCKVTVVKKEIPVTGIELNRTSATLTEGATLALTATVTPNDATDKSLTWSSSNRAVATVDNTGKVTAIAPGTATITATANDGSGVSASCKVTVVKKEIPVTGIELNRISATLTEGATLALTATVTPSDADDTSVTWNSSDPNVATVDNNGKVTAIAPGTATITATANDGSGVSASCKVTVSSASYVITYLVDGEVYATEALSHGATIVAPDAPTKEGHTFSGWSGLPETMPAKDITVSATFTVNKYQVTFKIDGVVIATYTQDYGSTIVAPEAPEREGYTFSGWGDVAQTVPASDVTYEGSYSVNSYTITYLVDGEVVHLESVIYGTTITVLDAPVKEGHTFSGWSGLPETMPAHDVTVSATFSINKYLVTFMIDGVVIASNSLEYGSIITIPSVPDREGYTFNGWSDVAQTVPAHDVIYDASYTANIYKVYYFVGATLVHITEVAYGEPIPEYVYEPTEEGYTFLGWIGETYNTMPAHDVTYTANIDDAIEQLTIGNAEIIYDLTGRKVTDTENLKGGIYIINGKKVVIND